MNFKDIHKQDIEDFLNLNGVKGSYDEAINLMCMNIVLPPPIHNWLIAYENKNILIKGNHLSDYEKAFNMSLTIKDVNQILYYLGDKTNYLSYLTQDLFMEVMLYTLNLRGVCKSIDCTYRSIIKSELFKKYMGQKILCRRGYKNTDFNVNLFNTIYNKSFLSTPIGIDMIKVIHVYDRSVYLSKNYKIYIYKRQKWFIAKINLPISDIIYKNGYFLISSGYIYTGKFKKVNCFDYRARSPFNHATALYQLNSIHDAIQLMIKNNNLYYMDTNGNLNKLTMH